MVRRPLTGEPLPLDLVNTRWPADGVMLDELDDPAGLEGWLREHGLEGDGSERCLEPLKTARAAIRRSLEQGDDDGVNAVLAHGRLHLSLRNGTPAEHVELDDEAWRPAWLAARAYLDLLSTAPPGRLRRCDGTGCVLWFLDTSRNGRRRWCSMTGCGNRAKVKAHYDRMTKADQPGG
ncbi:CGNR zinc finger domain-containing protein [Thermomonospora cellulosilytica]|uniref:Putative RNA-binding Zn ribbon-like protein n=1 Tax=Thermomonospora cellulosilytica TaxID=1411118 RepID=A0A7W3N0C8_9ACTN|nr:CGNR zinc finger domain-containing protein [Thermomonospora cellulosilytica]MBA9005213.1 putative RNA-binding Zn ribbon-like protein [Thermomonospora cellulosilytica]